MFLDFCSVVVVVDTLSTFLRTVDFYSTATLREDPLLRVHIYINKIFHWSKFIFVPCMAEC